MLNHSSRLWRILNNIKNIPELAIFIIFLLLSGYGFFHFGIENTILVKIIQVFFIIVFLTLVIFRFRKTSDTDEKIKSDKSANEEKTVNDINVIKQLADYYQTQKRMDSEQDFEIYLEKLLGVIRFTMDAQVVNFYLLEHEKNIFSRKVSVSKDFSVSKDHELSPQIGITGRMVKTKNPVIENSISQQDPIHDCCSEHGVMNSFIGAPIILREEIIGILSVHSTISNAFVEDDKMIVQGYSDVISKTIQNYNSIFASETSSALFSSFYEISKGLNTNLNFNEILEKLMDITRQIFDFDRISISLLEDSSNMARIHRVIGSVDEFPEGFRFPLTGGLNGWAIRNNKPLLVSDLEKDDLFIPRYTQDEKSNYGLRSFIAAPIGFYKKVLGVISVESKRPCFYVERHENVLVMLANNIGIALERSIINEKLESMATTDGLTGLNNHRSFRTRLKEEINRTKRHGESICLLMLDIDHFKLFNDRLGHLAGDQVLKEIGSVIVHSLRNFDYVARYGGEEFTAILIKAGIDVGLRSAERVRKNIATHSFMLNDNSENVTVSIGVAEFPSDADNDIELIERADKALYKAKSAGRNRVISYRES